MNIYEKISEIMKNVQYMNKDDHVKFGNTNYKALSEEKVTTIMREHMVQQGLIVFPIEMEHSKNGQISHVDVKYRILNVENPEEYIDVVSCGDGADSQDKGAGKAMTYAFKYMWLRTFAIPTGEDSDKISSAELDAKQKQEESKQAYPPRDEMEAVCAEKYTGKRLEKLLSFYKVAELDELTDAQLMVAFNKA